MLKKLKINSLCLLRPSYSTRVAIDDSLKPQFESKEFKPRKHPGTNRIKIAAIPPDIRQAIRIILEDNKAKSLYEDSVKLSNYIRSRLLPPESKEIDAKAAQLHHSISKKILSNLNDEANQKQLEEKETKIKTSVFNALKRSVYSWANISYDMATSLQYLMARAAPEYAILVRILDEISKAFPDYKPRSFFDFGSGVGTGTWAINTFWKGDIFEYFCVDTSTHMHDLARLILCNGKENMALPYNAYFQRQFLPASTDLKYNIVLSAFTLFELPDVKSRVETVQKLWNKTEDFLIIVEHGSNAGFHIVNEAREFILNKNEAFAFSPCPTDTICPRYMEQATPCNFLMKFQTLGFPKKPEVSAELFSYVVLKRGKRPGSDPQWPRIVRAPIVRSGHTVCRLCTKQGELKEIIFSKGKHDQVTYRCARSSNWGDLLPIK